MSPHEISLILFTSIFGGALFGVFINSRLPKHHLETSTKDVVKLVMGIVVTMSALVLGLLVSSAKTSYDAQKTEINESSAKIMLLDRLLAEYGPETKEARQVLREMVAQNIDLIWPQERTQRSIMNPPNMGAGKLYRDILSLSPADNVQHALQSESASLALGLGQTRTLMYIQVTDGVSTVFLLVLGFWLTAVFVSFGIYAPRNVIATSALFISAVSVSGAIFLILELYEPYNGIIKLSSMPLRTALSHLGQ